MKYSLRSLMIGVLLLWVVGGFSQDSKRRDLDLANHAPFASSVAKLTSLTMYEGLPVETKLLASELRTKKTTKFQDYPFYSETLTVSKADAATLTKICSDPASLAQFEKKFCEFHPDYCLEWKVGKETWRALICLGCGEVKFYGPKNMRLHCDLEKETYKNLKTMLKEYKKNRPSGDATPAP